MTPQEKRKQTIIDRYGSFSNMLKKRDVRDLILGGYNGGIKRTKKGFATWEDGKLKRFVATRERDKQGRFVAKAKTQSRLHNKTRQKPDVR